MAGNYLNIKALTVLLIMMIPSVLYARIHDRLAASKYLTESITDPVEGVWEIPVENTVVAIVASETVPDKFDIVFLEGADCRVQPGDIIGSLEKTIDRYMYRCCIYSTVRHDILTNIKDCSAVFNDKEGTLRIHPRKVKISLRPNSFLPAFWRMIHIRLDNDRTTELPLGFGRLINAEGKEVTHTPVYL